METTKIPLFSCIESSYQNRKELGVPASYAAVSADVPEEKAESYVRGTKLVPVDAVNLDFDAVALMGEYDDVLAEDDAVAILSKLASSALPFSFFGAFLFLCRQASPFALRMLPMRLPGAFLPCLFRTALSCALRISRGSR